MKRQFSTRRFTGHLNDPSEFRKTDAITVPSTERFTAIMVKPFFTDDWIWDAYRAHHPLRILLDPKKEEFILHSFVEMALQMERHWMPTFPEITGDSRRMNSNHGVASVIDAYRKGLKGFDLETGLSGLQSRNNGKDTGSLVRYASRETRQILSGPRVYSGIERW